MEPLLYRTALAINDALTMGRNRGLAPGQEIPDGRLLSKQECLDRIPGLDASSLTGGVLYHDAQMYSSERLVLAVVRSAVEAGAVAVNHAECTGPLLDGGRRVGVNILDRLDGSGHAIRARVVVNAAGPGAAKIDARLFDRPTVEPVSFSLAWNLVLDSVGLGAACALPGADATPTGRGGGERPRRLFVVPWRGRTLVGTGHAAYADEAGEFEGMGFDHPAMASFLAELNAGWFGDPLQVEDVVLIQSGLLPAYPGGQGEVRLRTRHVLTESDSGGIPVLTATTVKFTAARSVAEHTTDRACRILGHRASCRTAVTPLPGAPARGMDSLLSEARESFGSQVEGDVLDHLAHTHGTHFSDVLNSAAPGALARVSPDAPVLEAQWLHAIREEMAVTVDDLLFRRTELGARGLVDEKIRDRAEELLAAECAEVRP
jgi:glycerol-3-phosphate dehydrogenase